MEDFEALLSHCRGAVERFVKFKIPVAADAEDVLQEIYLTAYLKYGQLRDKDAFKPWLLSIARNRCSDYFRDKARCLEIPLEDLSIQAMAYDRRGRSVVSAVSETLALLKEQEKQILYLFYWKELPQADIARRLGIPVGTVKSRLHNAKNSFKARYPYPPKIKKGDDFMMTKLPEFMPEYTIEPIDAAPFSTRWEELQGWQIVPRLGEKLSWGLYDFPSRRRTEYTELEVVCKAEVHGIEGVEIVAIQYGAEDYYRTGCVDKMERRFIAQLTDTHSRYLAESHVEDGVRKCYTFLDGDEFLNNWGFGEDNCGNEVNLKPKGLLIRAGNVITGQVPRETVDIVGRYAVTICGKTYDTVCVMDIQCFNDGVASEQFVDQNGRTVLWRRFNKDNWAIDRFGGKLWSEKLPDNQRLTINGETFVHWYDCLSDYVL